jgi:hypothetical protein
VTLILGMSKADGIYLSVDYRVTDRDTANLIDDESVKHLMVHDPPDPGGPKALFAYTGIAQVPDRDRTSVGDWLRETLRGVTEPFDVSMQHLRQRLDRDFARLRQPLVINLLVIEGQQRYLGELSNCKKCEDGSIQVEDSFRYTLRELTEPTVIVNGSASNLVVASRYFALLQRQLSVRPRRSHEHMKLLATVNRRIAGADPAKRVSPFCHVSYIGETDAPESQAFTERGESVPFRMPMIAFGVDPSFWVEQMAGRFAALMKSGSTDNQEADVPRPDKEEMDRHTKRRDCGRPSALSR